MRTPAEINSDSPHAVLSRRQHVRGKTRESTRKTSKNLQNPPQIYLKSTKIAPRGHFCLIFGTKNNKNLQKWGLRMQSKINPEINLKKVPQKSPNTA